MGVELGGGRGRGLDEQAVDVSATAVTDMVLRSLSQLCDLDGRTLRCP